MYFSDGSHERKQFGLIAHGLVLTCQPWIGLVRNLYFPTRSRRHIKYLEINVLKYVSTSLSIQRLEDLAWFLEALAQS